MTDKLADRLEDYRTIVQNAQSDSEIKTALAAFGYTDERLLAGNDLYQETFNLFTKQNKERQDVREVSEQLFSSRDLAEEAYEQTCKLCRIVFRKEPALQSIIPSVLVYSPFASWKLNAWKMYDALANNATALALLTPVGITAEVLQQRKDELDALEQLYNQRNIEEGEAQQATRDRDAKMDELKEYCRDLREMARIALDDRPQLLEKLGILVR